MPQLTKIQIQNRARRKRNRMRGLPTPPGTRPREYREAGAPIFKPVPLYGVGPDFISTLNRFLNPRHWWRR